MSESLLASLLRVLELAVVERMPNAAFHLLTPAPDWLAEAFEGAQAGAQGSLGGALPFLDQFLEDADVAWDKGPAATAASGSFVATVAGEDLLLRAMAVTVDERKLLILERLTGDADTRPILQKAREHELGREQLVRQISAVHAPAAAVHEGLQQLLGLSLTPEQRAVVDRIQQASAQVQQAMASLPSPPRHLRRQPRTR